jgi:hypothetical protein
MYARGILFGKMKYELGDHSYVRCPELGLMADIEFKTKGYFGGTYNAIGGVIKEIATDKVLYELSGLWHQEMFAKDVLVSNRYLIQIHDLTRCRLVRKSSCSMPEAQSQVIQARDLWKSKTSESPKSCGMK